jgi:hypothetical protein
MSRNSQINLHAGRALMMVANKYPSLKLTLVESLQNAIDAGAQRVFMGIDVAKRTVIVADDGDGVTPEAFDLALSRVAETRKSKDKIGRFGIGLVSPLNKCERFTFTSYARTEEWPMEWTFEQAKIERRATNILVPCRQLAAMPAIERPFTQLASEYGRGMPWRTIVRMHNVTKDRVISAVTLDELEEQFLTKLGPKMREKDVTCRVVIFNDDRGIIRDIVPQEYTGEPLDRYIDEDPKTGVVEFELYRAKRIGGRRKGRVGVTARDKIYPLPWHEFVAQARGFGWSTMTEAFEVLGSGVYEGLIYADITLADERNKFNHGDALLAVYVAIDTWYEKVGRASYDAEQEQRRDERYRQLSLGVMSLVRDM